MTKMHVRNIAGLPAVLDKLDDFAHQTVVRAMAEVGITVVAGSFEKGAVVTSTNEGVYQESTGKVYSWFASATITVPAGTSPQNFGGVNATAWVDRTNVTLRSDLAAITGAGLVGTTDGITVQAKLNAIDAADLALDSVMKGRVGTDGGLSFRNKIVDGRFDFWYEGTSQTTSGYGSDTMWHNSNFGSTKVNSQQPLVAGVDLPAIEVPSAKYFSRTVVTSVAGTGNGVYKQQVIESVATLAGKSATLTFYAKADAIKNIAIEFNQNFGDGGSAPIGFGNQLVSLSTIWKRYSITVTVPSLSGKTIETTNDGLLIRFWFDAGSNFATNSPYLGQQSGTFDIACVQLEEGSVATPFEELPMEISQLRVNRYFQSIDIHGDFSISYSPVNHASTNPIARLTKMRAIPSNTITPISGAVIAKVGTGVVKATCTSCNVNHETDNYFIIDSSFSSYTYAAGDFLYCALTITFDARL